MSTKRIVKMIIIRTIAVLIFVSIGIFLSTNATVTNDVALNQLNGGDEAYLAQELYYKYKSVAPVIGAAIVIWTAAPIFKIIYNKIKSTKDTKEN